MLVELGRDFPCYIMAVGHIYVIIALQGGGEGRSLANLVLCNL